MKREDILGRLNEIKKIHAKFQLLNNPLEKSHNRKKSVQTFEDGVTIIIPSYKGEEVIGLCLESLFKQTLEQELFDVIFILNGEKDSSEQIIQSFIEEKEMNNITVLYSEIRGVSNARNLGLKNAKRKYTLFVDDDDYLSENYLEEMYRNAEEDTVVVSQIVDVDANGTTYPDNAINKQVICAESRPCLDTLNMVATINACKLVPTDSLYGINYDPELRSGEDVVFFTKLFVKNDLKLKVLPINKQVIYYRLLRDNSVSRQAMTFDFYVVQRLDVINRLDQLLLETTDNQKQIFIKQKINAQALFINKYIKKQAEERENVIQEIKKRKLTYFPYSLMNKGLASKLIISYCFPPYVDTSGNVMAKRIRHMNDVVDVVYNKMEKVRQKDEKLNSLIEEKIEKRIEISSYTSFSNWQAIEDFCKLGLDKIDNTKPYQEVYSRALWPGSHFLAYQYKIQNPSIKWIAEFSDPLLLDIHGKMRNAQIDNPTFLKEANKQIKRKENLPTVKDSNLFFWSEYLPYIFADELIFTNENQLNYMIDSFPIKYVQSMIKNKAKISPQPTLPKEFYYVKESNYGLDKGKVNLAYFGTFYQTRNLDELFAGLENVSEKLRDEIRLHIFTANPEKLQEEIIGSKIAQSIIVNPYVTYLEFLNLTTKFDCLIVNDAKTSDHKPINPYLPSKLSDYIGSGSKIWGIYEKGSVLSHYPLRYKSELGKIKDATNIYSQIVEETIRT